MRYCLVLPLLLGAFKLWAFVEFDLYQDKNISELIESKKTAILVASGFSDYNLFKMYKGTHLELQKRALVPLYLLASKIFKRGGKMKLVYLTFSPISYSYRRYLYKLATQDYSFHGFSYFERNCIEFIFFAPGPKGNKNFLFQGSNKEQWKLLKKKIKQIKKWPDHHLLGFAVHGAGDFLQKIAKEIDVSMMSANPEMNKLDSKSGSREAFLEAGVAHPLGTYIPQNNIELLVEDISQFLTNFKKDKILLKIDIASLGNGNILLDFSKEKSKLAIYSKIKSLPEFYLERLKRYGAIIEEFVEGENLLSPGLNSFIIAKNVVKNYFHYQQEFISENLKEFIGCRGPLKDDWQIKKIGQKIGNYLSEKGIIGNFGTDFISLYRKNEDGIDEKSILAIENNIRHTGASYPYLCTWALTNDQSLSAIYIKTRQDIKGLHFTNPSLRERFSLEFYNWLLKKDFSFNPSLGTGLFVHQDNLSKGTFSVTIIDKSSENSKKQLNNFLMALKEFLGSLKYGKLCQQT